MKSYKTINQIGLSEFKIKKSKFYGVIKPIETKEEAEKFIEEIKKKNYDARHNVPIYVIGSNYEIQKYSDDGEPSGTAGLPILEMLKNEGITNVVIVITRYFGGIKLGTGGLLRAYLKSAKLALDNIQIVEKKVFKKVSFSIDYLLHGRIMNYIKNNEGVELDKEEFSDKVEIKLFIKLENFDRIEKDFINLSSGQIAFKNLGEFYLSFINELRID
jgi:uncharacterized YigZ family protein